MHLSAIVPATDAPADLERCIEAIRSSEEPPDEVIVVDDAPGPGPAAARNAGAAQAKGDVLVFVDSDVLPHSDAFRRIRGAFRADPELAGVFGSYDDSPEAADVVSGFRNLLHHFVHQHSAGEARTFYTQSSIEDIELGVRLSASGARLRLDPTLQGTHLKRWTLAKMIQTDLYGRAIPWVALLARENAAPTGLNLGWRHRLSAAASIVLVSSLATRRPRQAGVALGALVALNASFYALLLRRRGPAEAAVGVGLHALHHLTGACAVPLGLVAHARDRRT